MKHIFTIHSPITFLAAYSIVEHLNLNKEDVLFISSAYDVPINKYKVVPSFAEKNQRLLAKLRYLNVPMHYDKYIDEITGGDEFIAYIDLMAYYQKILVSHEKCSQFHFFEEGNSAYMAWDDLTDLTWADRMLDYRSRSWFSKETIRSIVRIIRGGNLRLMSIPYHYMAYVNFKRLKYFSFSNNAFYNAPKEKKVLLNPDSSDPNMLKLAKGIRLKEEVIWIDGSNSRFTGLPETYYKSAVTKAITKLKDQGIIKEKIYVKLRPGFSRVEDNFLSTTLYEKGFEVVILPGDLQVECLFISSENCKVIGNLSAALEYATVFGHKSYSIYSLFEKQPATYFDRMTGFWENVETVN